MLKGIVEVYITFTIPFFYHKYEVLFSLIGMELILC